MVGAAIARPPARRRGARFAAAVLAVAAALAACVVTLSPAMAQTDFLNFREQLRPKPTGKGLAQQKSANGQMLVQADEIRYDNANDLVWRSAMCRSTTAARRSKPTRWSTTSAPSGSMPRAMRD